MLVRDAQKFLSEEYDLLVVGAGIFGACAAWDATLRGLRVLLIDKNDFGSAASANSFKMIHGGIRYMQHLNLARVRSSCHERSAFLRIAPHLVRPLPIAMPTFGYGTKGKPFLAAGMWAYDVLTLDRNSGIYDSSQKIPMSMCMSRAELMRNFPDLSYPNLTGAAVFKDAQMYNPTRLVLAFVQSAVRAGAIAANYTSACKFLVEDDRVRGCIVKDEISGDEHEVKCRAILNASGPWAEELISANGLSKSEVAPATYSRDSCFVIKRRFDSDLALAIPGVDGDSDALLSRSARHLFVVPWREFTLVGVWHRVWNRGADAPQFSQTDLDRHLNEINRTYPTLDLKRNDVLMWNSGLLPFGDQSEQSDNLSFGKESSIIDHWKEHGVRGLVSLIGVRYTMGRADASRALDMLLRDFGKNTRGDTARTPVFGGDFRNFEELVRSIQAEVRGGPGEDVIRAVVHNHGTNSSYILRVTDGIIRPLVTIAGTKVLRAEVCNAIRSEMAVTLADVVFRRTDLATGGNPGLAAIGECADIMAAELNWDDSRRSTEIQAVMHRFPNDEQFSIE